MKRGLSADDILKPLSETDNQVYLSNYIQMADVIDWIVSQSGKAEIWLTSFSISEEFIRRLFYIRQRCEVSRINLVLDFKATTKTLCLWPFLSIAIDRVYLSDNHSKILLVKGERLNVAVVTSQNLTRGNRHEVGIISTDPGIFDSLYNDVSYLITEKSISLNDVLSEHAHSD